MHEEEKVAMRSLISCVPVAVVVPYALCALHHKAWAICYATGAILSLFSLFSLTVLVPMLFRPGSRSSVKAALCLTLFMKIPIYMVALYLMTQLAASGAAAAVVGIVLAPMVITIRAVVGMVYRPAASATRARRAARLAGSQRHAPAEGG
jgi:hypothetical protein